MPTQEFALDFSQDSGGILAIMQLAEEGFAELGGWILIYGPQRDDTVDVASQKQGIGQAGDPITVDDAA